MAVEDDYPQPTTQRVVIIGGPWEARIGREGCVMDPPKSGCYPQDVHGEVLVRLDDDPFLSPWFAIGIKHVAFAATIEAVDPEVHPGA